VRAAVAPLDEDAPTLAEPPTTTNTTNITSAARLMVEASLALWCACRPLCPALRTYKNRACESVPGMCVRAARRFAAGFYLLARNPQRAERRSATRLALCRPSRHGPLTGLHILIQEVVSRPRDGLSCDL
jgi:hypothetical protein